MLLTQSHVDLFGYCTVALAFLSIVFSLTCGSYVLYLRWRIGKEHLGALRGFNTFWAVRLALVAFATLWAVLEVLRLPLVRRHGRLLGSVSYSTQGLLCKGHLVVSTGLAIPCFFLSALFLVRDSVQSLPFCSSHGSNSRLLLCTLFCGLPCLLLQLLLALFLFTGEGSSPPLAASGNGKRRMPSLLIRAFQHERNGNGVEASGESSVAVCTYPLLSTAVLFLFSALYSLYFSRVCFQTLSLVINKTLRRRILGLLAVFVVLLPLHAVLLGCSLIWTPGHVLHETILYAAFLNLVVATSIGQGILVFQPIHDTLDAHVMQAVQTGVTGFKGIHDIILEAADHSSEDPMIMITDAGLSRDYAFSSDEEGIDDYKGKLGLDAPLVPPPAAPPPFSKRHSYTLGVLQHPPHLDNRSPSLPGRPFGR